MKSKTTPHYKVQDPVWARIPSFPWWPARLITPAQAFVPPNEPYPRLRKGQMLVEFFNDRSRYAVLSKHNLRPFQLAPFDNPNPNYNGPLKNDLDVAIAHALAYCKRRRGSHLAPRLDTLVPVTRLRGNAPPFVPVRDGMHARLQSPQMPLEIQLQCEQQAAKYMTDELAQTGDRIDISRPVEKAAVNLPMPKGHAAKDILQAQPQLGRRQETYPADQQAATSSAPENTINHRCNHSSLNEDDKLSPSNELEAERATHEQVTQKRSFQDRDRNVTTPSNWFSARKRFKKTQLGGPDSIPFCSNGAEGSNVHNASAFNATNNSSTGIKPKEERLIEPEVIVLDDEEDESDPCVRHEATPTISSVPLNADAVKEGQFMEWFSTMRMESNAPEAMQQLEPRIDSTVPVSHHVQRMTSDHFDLNACEQQRFDEVDERQAVQARGNIGSIMNGRRGEQIRADLKHQGESRDVPTQSRMAPNEQMRLQAITKRRHSHNGLRWRNALRDREEQLDSDLDQHRQIADIPRQSRILPIEQMRLKPLQDRKQQLDESRRDMTLREEPRRLLQHDKERNGEELGVSKTEGSSFATTGKGGSVYRKLSHEDLINLLVARDSKIEKYRVRLAAALDLLRRVD